MLQVLADDWLPISVLVAVAVVKDLLSSDFFMQGMSRLACALSACMELAGWLDGRAMDCCMDTCLPCAVAD